MRSDGGQRAELPHGAGVTAEPIRWETERGRWLRVPHQPHRVGTRRATEGA